jgi:hypothetical protein
MKNVEHQVRVRRATRALVRFVEGEYYSSLIKDLNDQGIRDVNLTMSLDMRHIYVSQDTVDNQIAIIKTYGRIDPDFPDVHCLFTKETTDDRTLVRLWKVLCVIFSIPHDTDSE